MSDDSTQRGLGKMIFKSVEATFRWLCRYHDYRLYGLENLPAGGVIVAFNHSLATYDSFLSVVPIFDRFGRKYVGIADRLVFRTPVMGRVFKELGFISGTRQELVEKLRAGEMVGIAPGGTREMLRSRDQKHQIDWTGRFGFVWVSLMSGAPIVLAACPQGDEIFDVIPNPVTPFVYEKLHVPLPLFRGRGGLPVPRPVKLWHVLSEPIYPTVKPEEVTPEVVERHHAYVTERMKRLMDEAKMIAERPAAEPARASA
jgi:1-acyl-sn-glycerol-3-phosphate acyltransferase